jgi:Tol biopolymer transport system component
VVFESDASDLVPGDTNGVTDIFVRDVVAGTTTLVSVATNGGPANGSSSDATMTPDGRYVVFISSANNLVPNDTNGIPDVFVRDLTAQTTTLVSVDAIPASGTTNAIVSGPVITPDGRYVAFCSSARGLAAGAPANSPGEIYVRDLVSKTTTWASTNAATIVANLLHMNNMPSYYPRISDDGRYVAFECGTNNSGANVSGPVNNPVAVLQYDSTLGTTAVVNTNGCSDWLGAYPDSLYDDGVYGLQMSPNGRFIAFVVTNQPMAGFGVRLWDGQAGTDTLVSVCLDGTAPTNSTSCLPAVSPEGWYVAFLSDATNLTTNAVSMGLHVYLRDLQVGTNWLVDADTNGIGSSDEWGTTPGLSSNGQFVAFSSVNDSLVSGDNNKAFDVFVHDIIGGTNELISQRNPAAIAQAGNGISSLGPMSISADGRWVTYASCASDLVTNDFNGDSDIFVYDQATGSNILVSVGSDGNAGSGGDSYSPSISADGRYIVFASLATNLVAGVTNGFSEIFLRDIQQGTNMLVSTNSLNLGSGESSYPVISADGRHVVFLCGTNPAASYPSTFWRDLNSGQTVELAASSSIGQWPSISADGRYTAYFTNAIVPPLSPIMTTPEVLGWDSTLATIIYASPASVTSAAISPSGGRMLYESTNRLYVWDLIGGSNLFTCPSAVPIQSSSQWSSDGRFFVFVTASSFVPGDNNSINDVFLCDLQTGTITLISENAAGTGSANGPSDWPVISGDGRFVVFRSFATDLTPGINNTPGLFAFDRLTGSTTLLATGDNGSWTHWVSQPMVTTNGTAVFQSWDSGLIAGDLNRSQDVFAEPLNAISTTDSDGDGIPDWWMIKYFGHPIGMASDHSLAQDDADGTGMSNLQKYMRDWTRPIRLPCSECKSAWRRRLKVWCSVGRPRRDGTIRSGIRTN